LLVGTVTMPYGLTSPFAGIVVAIGDGLGCSGPMNGAAYAAAATTIRNAHAHPAAIRAARRTRSREIMVSPPWLRVALQRLRLRRMPQTSRMCKTSLN
jgi:hypothetical protein